MERVRRSCIKAPGRPHILAGSTFVSLGLHAVLNPARQNPCTLPQNAKTPQHIRPPSTHNSTTESQQNNEPQARPQASMVFIIASVSDSTSLMSSDTPKRPREAGPGKALDLAPQSLRASAPVGLSKICSGFHMFERVAYRNWLQPTQPTQKEIL